MSQAPPSLDGFELGTLRPPRDNEDYIWFYESDNNGFWWLEWDEDIALQEATGYPVGELVEYEHESDDWNPAEDGELRIIALDGGSR